MLDTSCLCKRSGAFTARIRFSVVGSGTLPFSSNTNPPKSNDDGNSAANPPKSNDGGNPAGAFNPKNVLNSPTVNASTRAMGQVIFLNDIDCGRVILCSLAYADPTLASLAALGAVTATSTSKAIGLDKNTWENGLWGYNGALIGCVASGFGPQYFPMMVVSTMVGAAATPVLSASLNSALSMPQWTWSFNVVALTSLLRTQPLLETGGEVVAVSTGMKEIALSPLLGISQIFVVDSAMTGVGIVAATYMYSPKLAAHAVGGSALGCIVGIMLGADLSDVALGLWGYNSALASMAVGTFFVHSRKTMMLSASSAAASAALFGAMSTLFGSYGVPCLTLPFCAVASASYLLDGHIPGLKIAKEPHSPEKNK